MRLFTLILFAVISVSNYHSQTPGGGVTDIDGNQYATVIIGTQEWMAENLRTTRYSNGNSISNVTDQTTWLNLTSGSWCHYNNDSQYENPYGKLYNYYVANDTRNVCPNGWHVPSITEWDTLVSFLGGESVAGTKMKSVGTQYWQSPNSGTNESGFNGLPGGNRSGNFLSLGVWGYWWSSTEFNSGGAWLYSLNYLYTQAVKNNPAKVFGYSIRCINNITLGTIELKPDEKVLIKIIDLMGRQTEFKPNTPLIYLYNDGSVEKVFVVQ
jgi:uncharacterized protein (TIGR02145 family)